MHRTLIGLIGAAATLGALVPAPAASGRLVFSEPNSDAAVLTNEPPSAHVEDVRYYYHRGYRHYRHYHHYYHHHYYHRY